MDVLILAVAFVIILLGAELFTNGIEWFGRKLQLAEGAVGSVLAAVGTALPETMIPIIAILAGAGSEASHGVGRLAAATERDRDDRDHRLRQRRPHRGEHGPNGPFGQLELAAEPLDAVREQLGADEDHDKGDREDEQVHLSLQTDGGHDGPEHDEQHGERDQRQARVTGGEEPDAGDDDPAERQREHRDEAQPQEPERVAGGDLGGDGGQVERGHPTVGERVDPRREHEQDADEDEPHREVGPGHEQA